MWLANVADALAIYAFLSTFVVKFKYLTPFLGEIVILISGILHPFINE